MRAVVLVRVGRRTVTLGLLAVIAVGCSGNKTADKVVQDVPAAKPLAVGDSVPSFRAVTIGGDSAFVGGAGLPLTLVNVWATWCTSCREEMADLESIYKESAPKGLRVLAVSVDGGSPELVKRYVAHEQLTFPVVHDRDGVIQARYQIMGIPSTYLIGADGRLLWQRTGGIHGATAEARAAVAAAIR